VAELRLVAEGEPPHDRVQPVGAHDQPEPAGRAVVEGDHDPVVVRIERADRIAEHVLDVVAGRLVDDRGEFAAHDLDVPLRDPGDQAAHVDLDPALAGPLERDPVGLRPGVQDRRQDPHPLGDVDGRPEQVDRVAAQARAQGRRAFDHSGREAVPAQPVRERRSGHAGTGDEHVRVHPLDGRESTDSRGTGNPVPLPRRVATASRRTTRRGRPG
jgi:hypothetical protein